MSIDSFGPDGLIRVSPERHEEMLRAPIELAEFDAAAMIARGVPSEIAVRHIMAGHAKSAEMRAAHAAKQAAPEPQPAPVPATPAPAAPEPEPAPVLTAEQQFAALIAANPKLNDGQRIVLAASLGLYGKAPDPVRNHQDAMNNMTMSFGLTRAR